MTTQVQADLIAHLRSAYSHPHWAVVSLYRRSNSRSLACASQIAELIES